MNKKNKNGRSETAPFDFSGSLAKTVLNSLSANIAILDEYGVILETNQAWRNYATENKMAGSDDTIGVIYLALCDATTGKEAKYARDVAAGIRSVIKGTTKEFLYDYPCHGPDGRRFFYLRAIRVAEKEPIRVVVSHEDITALKLAEESLRKREKERDRLRRSLELAKEVQQILEWVRAGHEPAICYDPAANDFLELSGSGMALGVDKQCQYEINRKEDLSRGSIIVMGTDGVWETRNESGQMFGRTAIYDIIRDNSAAGAGDIMEEIFDRYKKFRKAAQPEDDVSLVVAKLL